MFNLIFKIIAISQRNLDIFNPAMSSYSQIIIDKISACFEHKLGNIFASKCKFIFLNFKLFFIIILFRFFRCLLL